MKAFFSLVVLCFALVFCNSPKPVITTPGNHTNTSGTVGSGTMTNTLPDTTATKRDSLPVRQ